MECIKKKDFGTVKNFTLSCDMIFRTNIDLCPAVQYCKNNLIPTKVVHNQNPFGGGYYRVCVIMASPVQEFKIKSICKACSAKYKQQVNQKLK